MSRRSRKKKLENEEDENVFISSEDIVNLDGKTIKDLPYLKCIELTKHKPQQFDLDKWHTTFTLPNSMMKKIYRNDVYHDTDFPVPEPESITPTQKKILNDYVKNRKRDKINTITKTRHKPPLDCLLECLGRPYFLDVRREKKLTKKDLVARRQSNQGQPLFSLNKDNIAICSNHKVQPENVIVKIALEKMKELSVEEEQRYQELLKDQEFMQELNNCVKKYLRREHCHTNPAQT